MKKIFLTLAAAIALSAPVSHAFDLKDLLGGMSGSSSTSEQSEGSDLMGVLGGLVKGMISTDDITVADLAGEWKYTSPAFTFESSDLLQKAGGAAMSSIINSKLEPYYRQAGIDKLEATFSADSTFVFKLPRATVRGTVQKAEGDAVGDFIFSFNALGKIPVGKMKAHIEKAGRNSMTITFDVSKLVKVVDAIAKYSKKKSLETVSSLLNKYEGLNCGFELTAVSLSDNTSSSSSNASAGSTTGSSASQSGKSASSAADALSKLLGGRKTK